MGFLMKKKIVERELLMWTIASIIALYPFLDCFLMGEFLKWRDGIWSHQKRVTFV